MKRFLVFGWNRYYPCGGWNDFRGDFASETEAMRCLQTWAESDDSTYPEGCIVEQSDGVCKIIWEYSSDEP